MLFVFGHKTTHLTKCSDINDHWVTCLLPLTKLFPVMWHNVVATTTLKWEDDRDDFDIHRLGEKWAVVGL